MARTHDILPETSPAGQAQFLVAFHQQQNSHFEEAAKGLRSASRPNIFMKIASSLHGDRYNWRVFGLEFGFSELSFKRGFEKWVGIHSWTRLVSLYSQALVL